MMLQYRVGTIRSITLLAAFQHDTKKGIPGIQDTSGSVWEGSCAMLVQVGT